MTGLRMSQPLYDRLADELLRDSPMESAAIGYAVHDDATQTWFMRDANVMGAQAYAHRSPVAATLSAHFAVTAANGSRARQETIVVIHTHPFAKGQPSFSTVDDGGEEELSAYFARRAPIGDHLALVIGPEGCRARRLGTRDHLPVHIVGNTVRRSDIIDGASEADEWADRQVRAFGTEGQRIIHSIHVGIVGLGGTGSIVAQELAHLGASKFTLIDLDKLETTNLNRVAGSRPDDVGTYKVEVAHRMIAEIRPSAEVQPVIGDVVDEKVAAVLQDCDFIFLCTDSHASRAVVNQVAYQRLIPTIDMGTSITVNPEGRVTHISGRTQMLAPGLPCLVCCRTLDGEEIRREMMSPEERARDQYIVGDVVPQPAVMSINATSSSLAVTMFLGAMTGVPAKARWQRYDAINGQVREMTASIDADCIVCSSEGALAQGSRWPLPTRKPRREAPHA